jgi:hypothetical protein
MVSSARTDEVLKVIVTNPSMIEAFKNGVPKNGALFPDGSRIVKLQWKPKKSTAALFAVDVPDAFTQAFVGGWDYAPFNYDTVSDTIKADPSPLDCGFACDTAVKAKDYIFRPL